MSERTSQLPTFPAIVQQFFTDYLVAQRVRAILTNGRDQLTPSTTPEWVSPAHAHVRGPAYYH